MSYLSPRTAANRLRAEDGNVLVTVILVSMLIGALAALGLNSGRQSDWASASDRNYEAALALAEAGVHEAVAQISAHSPDVWSLFPGQTTTGAERTTSQGRYRYRVTRCDPDAPLGNGRPGDTSCRHASEAAEGFIIDALGHVGVRDGVLERSRAVRVYVVPPSRFENNEIYALFSRKSIEVQNNDQILDGDVFANDSIRINNSNAIPTIRGSVTSAQSWIRLENGVSVTGSVWSGGFNGSGWAISMGGGAKVEGGARASVTAPTAFSDPDEPDTSLTCEGENPSNYNVVMASNAQISNGLTTLGQKTGPGSGGVAEPYRPGQCTAASPWRDLPAFTFDPDNYDHVHEFNSVQEFRAWFSTNSSNFKGTFLVNHPGATQADRIDLSGARMTGSVTLVTDAPVFTGNMDDSAVPCSPTCNSTFVIVSRYKPVAAEGSPAYCNPEQDSSDCAVQIKNQFNLNADGSCKTATLIYANEGPVAIKNGQKICGSVISHLILVKNNQTLTYDKRIDRIVGFGEQTYAIDRWVEIPPSSLNFGG